MTRDRYAVIGNPVAHSRSPWIHAEFARATGQMLDYERIEAPLEGFEQTVDGFRREGGKGLNVTVPFKEAAYRYCDTVTARARAAQAVNTLVFLDEVLGDNTDGAGLVADLTRNLAFSLAGRKVLLVGAGGAAAGVVRPLLDAGVGSLVIANRSVAKAEALGARFGVHGTGFDALEGQSFDLIVNATSAGLSGEAPALPAGVLNRARLAYDMVYGRDTPFLAHARAAGAAACDGLGMLVEQAAEAFFVWRGVRPQTQAVLERLRAAA